MNLLRDDVVIELSGNEFIKKEDKTFVQQVEEYYQNQGGKANSLFGIVLLDKKGIKNSKSHGMSRVKASAFAAIKDVLEKGLVILPLGNHVGHDKKQQTGMIAAPIKISNERYICVVMVIANLHEQRLYVHEAFIAKNLREIVAASRIHNSENTTSSQSQGEIAKVLINFLNRNYSSTDLENNWEKLTTNISIDKDGNHKNANLSGADYISENSNYNNINTMANKTKKALYESIMKDVAKTVKRHLNEAIHSELIDKQIYNSVNAFIRKYSPDELRILKPAKRFTDVNALIQAYVCALKILGFDCPQSEDEFDVIGESHEYNSKYTGAFSEYAKQAIRMGGSIDDIIYLYNNTPDDNSTMPFGKPVKKKTEVDLYKVPAPDRLILDRIWKNVDDVRNLFDSTIKLNKDLYYVIMGAIFENSHLSTSDRILNVCKLIKKFATIN